MNSCFKWKSFFLQDFNLSPNFPEDQKKITKMSIKRTYEDMMEDPKVETPSTDGSLVASQLTLIADLSCGGWKEEDIPSTSPLFTPGKRITKVIALSNINSEEADGFKGKADVEYLMHYSKNDTANPHASIAEYNGILKITAEFKGRKGSFLCQEIGTFADMKAESRLTILPNSGSDGFTGITGSGESVSNFGGKSLIKLVVNFSEKTTNSEGSNREEIAVEFLQLSCQGKVDEAMQLCDESVFKHHNLHFPGDMLSLKNGMKESHDKFPDKVLEVKKVFHHEDEVATYSLVKLSKEVNVMVSHRFRFNDRKRIVELWDIAQVVPETPINENGPF